MNSLKGGRRPFGFTPAEHRIAILISDGKSFQEIVGLLGISLNTLKTHLGHMYDKTHTSRHAQLMRVLLKQETR